MTEITYTLKLNKYASDNYIRTSYTLSPGHVWEFMNDEEVDIHIHNLSIVTKTNIPTSYILHSLVILLNATTNKVILKIDVEISEYLLWVLINVVKTRIL